MRYNILGTNEQETEVSWRLSYDDGGITLDAHRPGTTAWYSVLHIKPNQITKVFTLDPVIREDLGIIGDKPWDERKKSRLPMKFEVHV